MEEEGSGSTPERYTQALEQTWSPRRTSPSLATPQRGPAPDPAPPRRRRRLHCYNIKSGTKHPIAMFRFWWFFRVWLRFRECNAMEPGLALPGEHCWLNPAARDSRRTSPNPKP